MDKWWVPGLQIGYEHSFVHQFADFVQAISKGEVVGPTFEDAQVTQQVCESVLASGKDGNWHGVAE